MLWLDVIVRIVGLVLALYDFISTLWASGILFCSLDCFVFQAEDGIRDVAVTGVQLFFSSRRRHTRCSRDWSSDVCSSDLLGLDCEMSARPCSSVCCSVSTLLLGVLSPVLSVLAIMSKMSVCTRSEERRVGKECRSRWAADH